MLPGRDGEKPRSAAFLRTSREVPGGDGRRRRGPKPRAETPNFRVRSCQRRAPGSVLPLSRARRVCAPRFTAVQPRLVLVSELLASRSLASRQEAPRQLLIGDALRLLCRPLP